MAKGLSRSIRRADALSNAAGFRRVRYELNPPLSAPNMTIAAAGAGVGFGSIPLALPEGYLVILSVFGLIQLATTSTNITNASFTGAVGLGSVATVAGALTGTEVDFVAQVALSATAKAQTGIILKSSAVPIVATLSDNHTVGTKTINLNMFVAAGDITDASSAPFSIYGHIDVLLAVMGDS